MAEKLFPRFQQYEDFSIYAIADDDEQREAEAQEIDRRGTEAFLAAHPEYYECDENDKLLEAWLYIHGDLPFTLWNLEIGFRDLLADGLLQTAPPAEPVVDTGNPSIVLSVTDRLAEYVPSDTEVATLAKLQDDPSLNDHQRKVRLRKLALLAGQQRRELAPQNLYR
jgi:hypothetical protein